VSRMARGRRVWSVRFRDGGRQRTIYIGGDNQPELLKRARSLLMQFREEASWPREIARYAKAASTLALIARRLTGR